MWAIDNGLCFAADDKLRTVIWEFADEPLPAELGQAVQRAADVSAELAGLLDADEIAALSDRARRLMGTATFPAERHGHGYPWPLV